MKHEDGVTERGMQKKKGGLAKRLWRRIRGPLARSAAVKSILVWLIASYLKLVHATNPRLKDSASSEDIVHDFAPFIVTFWHGQHLMGPFLRPKGLGLVAMFSRSADAELNARVAEKLGLLTVRGSGGRGTRANPEKGGARALLTLKNALRKGQSTSMIADIAHGKAREAGEGIILLAKLSGRPIIPLAYAFSRNHVLEKTWDKTTIPLPFGRSTIVRGDPVWVDADADDVQLEEKRVELTRQLNRATDRAYAALEKAK
ncbi:hypothetical protein BAZG_02177 [Brucella sp. NVSL 07-0026]|uniref:lysophospholipid acyltransferase family protein n=1 Tax=Brucella sp. NVSL 07-0026 TaxID=520448 RepID=UPI0001D0CA25|nr:lysophospholipid acyltransferase family protein [Brucella sp. NVSL 07-0026]EFG35884.1 hypothetical protein BAZG_02177 [Brucella sp. NVSL 07-0026]